MTPLQVLLWWNSERVLAVRVAAVDTALEFRSPPGEGATVNVTLVVGGQSARMGGSADVIAPAVLLSYLPPTVSRLSIRREPNQATMECFRATSDGRPSSGVVQSALLVIDGANFGVGGNTSVSVRGTPCVPTAISHTQIVCTVSVCAGGRGGLVSGPKFRALLCSGASHTLAVYPSRR